MEMPLEGNYPDGNGKRKPPRGKERRKGKGMRSTIDGADWFQGRPDRMDH